MLEQVRIREVKSLSFEEAIGEMEAIASYLEQKAVPLEEVIGLFERLSDLRKFCEVALDNAKLQIEKIAANQSIEC